MIPVIDNHRYIETNIDRVRTLVGHGLSLQEIMTTVTDLSPTDIFLAFHAAKILDSE
jgi:hypothetical protein